MSEKNFGIGELDRSWPALDFVRWAFAMCVVMIHVESFFDWDSPSVLDFIIHPSVPFFFISSGFLLGVKVEGVLSSIDRQHVILKYARRIQRMFLIWISLYAPLAIVSFWFSPEEGTTLGKFLFVQARSAVMFGEVRYSWPTWYLYSLCISAYALFVHEKYGFPKIILMVIGALGLLLLYVFTLNAESFSSSVINISRSLKNMTAGMLYVTVGYSIAFVRLKGWKYIVLASALLMISICFFVFDHPYWEGLAAMSVFLFSIQYVTSFRGRFGVYASKQSIWVYLLHMYVLTIMYFFSSAASFGPWIFWGVGCMVSIMLSSLAILAQSGNGGVSAFLRKLT